MYGKMSAFFAASVLRGLVISGILIFLLPITLGSDVVLIAIPITELLAAAGMALAMSRSLGSSVLH